MVETCYQVILLSSLQGPALHHRPGFVQRNIPEQHQDRTPEILRTERERRGEVWLQLQRVRPPAREL